jgi:integrase
MAIHLFCGKCKTSNGLEAKICSNCGAAFGRNRKFRVSVSVKGQRITRVIENLTLAREIESAIKTDMHRDEYDISHHKTKNVPTMADLWAKYLPWAKQHKKSWRDDEYYYRKHLEPRFGSKTLDNITGFDLERLKTELKRGTNAQGRPYAAQTIKHILVIVRRLYNLARKWGIYDGKNPVAAVSLPCVNNEVTEFLTDDELRRLLDTLDIWPCQETAAFIRFALLTGLRRGELFKLQFDDVDFERNLVTLRDPKPGKNQTVTISNEALEVLRQLEVKAGYVFPGRKGEQRTDFKGPWQRIRKAAGLPEKFRLHGLRHNFGSTMISNGVELATVRELLHHKDIKTTLRYAHLKPDAVKAAALKAGELLTRKAKAKVVRLAK